MDQAGGSVIAAGAGARGRRRGWVVERGPPGSSVAMEAAVLLFVAVFVVALAGAWPALIREPLGVLAWGAALAVATVCSFPVSRRNGIYEVSLGAPIIVAVAMQFDWAWAFALGFIFTFNWRELMGRAPWRMALYNRGQTAASAAVAAVAVRKFPFGAGLDHPMWAALVAVVVFVSVNGLLCGLATPLRSRGSAQEAVRGGLGPTWQAAVCHFGFVLIGVSVLVLGVGDPASLTDAVPVIVGGVLSLVGLHVAVQAREAQVELRAAWAHSMRAVEEERRAVGRYLHDEAVQSLSAAAVLLASSRRQMGTDAPGELIDAEQAVMEATSSARGLLAKVVPPPLEAGLGAAVARELDILQAEGYTTHLRDDLGDAVEPGQAGLAFAGVQEGLRNVRRHADADHVEVGLRRVDGAMEVIVADNGCGVGEEAVRRGPTNGHFGLTLVDEVARSTGGTLSLRDRPGGQGAQLVLRLPPMTEGAVGHHV